VRVAPFKAVNMANNARVVEGGEIGAAQYFQALAAGVAPAVEHDPFLVKPETYSRSQVVRLGRVDRDLSAMPWRSRAEGMWPIVRDAFDRVAGTADVVVIEGAGSPAEINLAASIWRICASAGTPTRRCCWSARSIVAVGCWRFTHRVRVFPSASARFAGAVGAPEGG
jgi:hypothetical protein